VFSFSELKQCRQLAKDHLQGIDVEISSSLGLPDCNFWEDEFSEVPGLCGLYARVTPQNRSKADIAN